MTIEKRLRDLEDQIAPNDEKCSLVYGLYRELPKCPKGRVVLSEDLHECEGCSILPKIGMCSIYGG